MTIQRLPSLLALALRLVGLGEFLADRLRYADALGGGRIVGHHLHQVVLFLGDGGHRNFPY